MEELLFCGENRKQALTRTIRAYDDLAAEVEGINPNFLPEEPIHKIVLIHAERGLGKTRLAMEFYKHLSRKRYSESYWPAYGSEEDAFTGTTPPIDLCNFESPPKFLWWAIPLSQSDDQDSHIFNAVEYLTVHLTAAHIAARMNQSGNGLAYEISSFAADVGIEIAEQAFDALPVIGYVKRVSEAAWNIGRIIHQQFDYSDTPISAQEKRSSKAIEGLLDDLSSVFNPSSRKFARAPLVLLVDDAQFMNEENPLAQLFSKLIERSARERWPLFLILTHWSRNLDTWEDNQGNLHKKSTVAQILSKAGFEFEPNSGREAPRSESNSFLKLDLGEPVSDLSPALLDQFPGIRSDTANEILHKSGNNPRKLEQIMSIMAENPIWFDELQFDKDLTESGREEVLSVSALEIDRIIAKRLHETPEYVRRAMALAASLGPSFVVGMVEDLAKKLGRQDARTGLEKGELTYHFLRNVVDTKDNDTGFFAEPTFFQAIQNYIKSGNAAKYIKEWPSEKDFQSSLRSMFVSLVEEGNPLKLRPDDLRGCMNAAISYFEKGYPDLAARACSHLIGLETTRGNYFGAEAVAHRFAAEIRENTWTYDEIPYEQLAVIGDVLVRIGELPMALEATTFAKKKLEVSNENRELSATEHALSTVDILNIRSNILTRMGRTLEANECIKASFELTKELAIENSADNEYAERFANACRRAVEMWFRAGDFKEARGLLASALTLYHYLYENSDRTNFELLRSLCWCFQKSGDMDQQEGDFQSSTDSYQKALKYRKILLDRFPTHPAIIIDYLQTQERLGTDAILVGNFQAANQLFGDNLDLITKHFEKQTTNINLKHAKASCLRNFGTSQIRIGDIDDGIKNIIKAEELCEEVLQASGSDTIWLRMQYDVYAQAAEALILANKHPDLAIALLEQANVIASTVFSEAFDDRGWRVQWYRNESLLGYFYYTREDYDKAIEHLKNVLHIYSTFVGYDIHDDRYELIRANSLKLLCDLGFDRTNSYQAALEIYERLKTSKLSPNLLSDIQSSE